MYPNMYLECGMDDFITMMSHFTHAHFSCHSSYHEYVIWVQKLLYNEPFQGRTTNMIKIDVGQADIFSKF
jgi:hypothetical protein